MSLEPAIPFGPKSGWLAFKGNLTEAAVEHLMMKRAGDIGWSDGIQRAHATAPDAPYGSAIFITPPLEGWTLAVGVRFFAYLDVMVGQPTPEFPPPFPELLKHLSAVGLRELQFFATHRGVEMHAWGKAADGQLQRAYATTESGVLVDQGARDDEEPGPEAMEEDIFALAQGWSFDPTSLDGMNLPKGSLLIDA